MQYVWQACGPCALAVRARHRQTLKDAWQQTKHPDLIEATPPAWQTACEHVIADIQLGQLQYNHKASIHRDVPLAPTYCDSP